MNTEELLTQGGDSRICLDSDGLNKYGCPPRPDPELVSFSSSTASVISEEAFAAADHLRQNLGSRPGPREAVYAQEMDRIRHELPALCGIADLPGLEIVFGASGSDIHLIAAHLAAGAGPCLAVMAEASETGSYVPKALAGRHFSTRSALGGPVHEGESVSQEAVIDVAMPPIRGKEENPKKMDEVDKEIESTVTEAVSSGKRVLLVLTDVSKTGKIAPSIPCALSLRRKHPDLIDILVDACQFRISPSTLRAYLSHGFMVAMTGSKFLTGPTFSGALFIPASETAKLRLRPLPAALKAYSCRADWPENWPAADVLSHAANFGLLLRWEAALAELRIFRKIPEERIKNFLLEFSHAVQKALEDNPLFEAVPVPPLDRSPLVNSLGWDQVQTIFPFLLLHPETREPLSASRISAVYQKLKENLGPELGEAASPRFQLGQPVQCGHRNGVPLHALRLCSSARLVAESMVDKNAVIAKALAALAKTALLIESGAAR